MAQITLQNPQILLILPLIWLLIVGFAWRRRFKPFGPFILRLLIVVLVILALARPTWSSSPVETVNDRPDERLIVLVDQSASLGSLGQQALRDEAARLTRDLSEAAVLYFADKTIWVDGSSTAVPAETAGDGGLQALDPTVSNLAQALALGGEMAALEATRTRSVLILGDPISARRSSRSGAARISVSGSFSNA